MHRTCLNSLIFLLFFVSYAHLSAAENDLKHKSRNKLKVTEAGGKGEKLISCTSPEEKFQTYEAAQILSPTNPALKKYLQSPLSGRGSDPYRDTIQKALTTALSYFATHDPETCLVPLGNELSSVCALLNFEQLQLLPVGSEKTLKLVLSDPRFPELRFERNIYDSPIGSFSRGVEVRYIGKDAAKNAAFNVIAVIFGAGKSATSSSITFSKTTLEGGSQEYGKQFSLKDKKSVNTTELKNATEKIRFSDVAYVDPQSGPCAGQLSDPADAFAFVKGKKQIDVKSLALTESEKNKLQRDAALTGLKSGGQNLAVSLYEVKEAAKGFYDLIRNKDVEDPRDESTTPKKIGAFTLLKRELGTALGTKLQACLEVACEQVGQPLAQCTSYFAFTNALSCTTLLAAQSFGEVAAKAIKEKVSSCITGGNDELSYCLTQLGTQLLTYTAGVGSTKIASSAAKGAQAFVASSRLGFKTQKLANGAIKISNGALNFVIDATLNQLPIDPADLQSVLREIARLKDLSLLAKLSQAESSNLKKLETLAQAIDPTRQAASLDDFNAKTGTTHGIAFDASGKKINPVLAAGQEAQAYKRSLEKGKNALIISDAHLGNSENAADAQKSFKSTLQYLKKESRAIDRVVVAGDIIDNQRGKLPVAERIKATVDAHREIAIAAGKLPNGQAKPVIVTFGNHDEFRLPDNAIEGLPLKRGRIEEKDIDRAKDFYRKKYKITSDSELARYITRDKNGVTLYEPEATRKLLTELQNLNQQGFNIQIQGRTADDLISLGDGVYLSHYVPIAGPNINRAIFTPQQRPVNIPDDARTVIAGDQHSIYKIENGKNFKTGAEVNFYGLPTFSSGRTKGNKAGFFVLDDERKGHFININEDGSTTLLSDFDQLEYKKPDAVKFAPARESVVR